MGAAVILAGLGKKMFYADKLILLAPMIRALRAPDGVRGYGAQVLSAAHKLTFRGRRYMGKHRPNGIGVSAGWVHSYYIFRKMLRDMKPINIPTLLILAEKDEGISGTDAIKFCQKKIEGFLDTSIHILAGADHNFDQGFARIPDSAKTTAHFMREQIVSLTNAI
jgi:alpha-beta hydrolase superfamily lysophospholipase